MTPRDPTQADGIVVVNRETGAIIGINKVLSTLLGRPQNYWIGRSALDLHPADQRATYLPLYAPGPRELLPASGELLRADGEIIRVDLSHLDFDLHGIPTLSVVMRPARGISRDRLETLGAMVSGVAHDFNNELTVISTLVNLLEGSANATDLDDILASVRRAAALTRKLLVFSRREVDRPTRLHLGQLVSEAHKMLRRLLPETVSFEIDLAEPRAWVRADPAQLEQAIFTMVMDARDALINGGTLSLRTIHPNPAPTVLGPGEWVGLVLRVRDGAALPGRGLPAVTRIAQRYDGRVLWPSDHEVQLFLPADITTASARTTSGTVVHAHILVVDDQPAICRMVARTLEVAGYDVARATSAEEAISLAKVHDFDILVTDVVLPGLNGRELAGQIDTPVIYMSGYTEDTILRAGIEAGQVDFLPKPFEVDDLLDMVAKLAETQA